MNRRRLSRVRKSKLHKTAMVARRPGGYIAVDRKAIASIISAPQYRKWTEIQQLSFLVRSERLQSI
eukprot:5503716-Pyramimonas_sp.AAC.2